MRLDFNVLWVEDQPDGVKSQKAALQRIMAEEGFDLKPTICSGPAEVQNWISDDVFTDEVDLILVDWDLGKGVEGQTVITEIRDRIHYRDVVFYSAVTDTSNLRQRSFNEGHEGVYFVHRNELVQEVTHLFKSMIKKVLDLDHTRGIVMGATSDVEQTARECLLLAHGLLDDAGKAGVLKEMVGLLDEKIPDLTKRVEKLKGKSASEIVAAHLTFTANDGLRILTRILSMEQFAAHKPHKESLNRYIQEVVPKRNILGHKVLSPDGKPQGIAGMPGETISLDELRALRRRLLELRQEFRNLHGALSAVE
ncbi:hypothetical protein [Methylocystis sp.]|uniref:hypothetical protein n=1 Tax=Methylocystis sp. TaxID=1911079 RepID=UPI003DA3D35B